MGLYDRDYGRDERTAWDRVENPRSITITLIVINVVVFFVDLLLAKQTDMGRQSLIAEWCAVSGDTLLKPWLWWQFVTYGFVHDIRGLFHVLFNMVGLFFFGRIVEQRIGRTEFLRFYLVSLVVGGIVGSLTTFMYGLSLGVPINQMDSLGGTIGASGAVIAGVILFACYYPNQRIYLMLVLPIKAWVAAVMFIAMDLAGALGMMQNMGSHSNTAFTVHLAGAFFALAYFFQKWNLRWLDLGAIGQLPANMRARSRRMKLKIHDPDKKLEKEAQEADRILAKIHHSGESSLTSSERKILERYSRRQRAKRNP